MNKKLSIIVPNYNNERYLRKSLDCLIEQTYKNVEIIVVNDGSQGNCDAIMQAYLQKDERIKYVKHEVNKGLFQARLTGAENATGDYIAFLDADDYTSIDFYRILMNSAEENNSDIVIGNTVLEEDDGERYEFNMFHMNFKELNGEECLKEYFRQRGLIYLWHTIWNKIYSMELWKKAVKHYKKLDKRLVMTEDFAFSTVLFYYANKITKTDYDCIFYCQHKETSTSVKSINITKERNNISDLLTSYNFVESFLKEVNVYDKYKEDFEYWKHLISLQHREIIKNSKNIKSDEKEILYDEIDKFCDDRTKIDNNYLFYTVKTEWDEELDNIKRQIASDDIQYVSFDIFDTLVVRPFYTPTDLFKFMDLFYEKNGGKDGISFSKMRINSENLARSIQEKENSEIEDITIDAIYEVMHELYGLDKELLDKLKEKEIEYEIRYCTRRNVSYELYSMAKALGKKIICVSDMYLSEDTIKNILDKNGYKDIYKLYLSSKIKKSKWTGNLYKYVLDDLKVDPSKIIHIGDNYNSDYVRACENKINAVHIVKTTEAMNNANNMMKFFDNSLPFWQDNIASMQFLGIRTMLALVANKYFDNPYRLFNKESDFNSDPYLIGYYVLGMFVFGVSKWILDNTKDKNDKISFMARDGYLFMEAYDILAKYYENIPKSEYMYISRKASVPIMIKDKMDLYKITDIVYHANHSPKDVMKYLKNVVNISEDDLKNLCEKQELKYDKNFKSLEQMNKLISLIADEYFDASRHEVAREKLKTYFEKILGEKPAVFDIGYSGRPEYYLSKLCDRKIDTYFLNILTDEGLDYSRRGQNILNIFLGTKPTSTGFAYELMFSKIAPSCIGYDVSSDEVKPIFEKFKEDYILNENVKIMQNAAIDFVNDVCDIFGDNLSVLYYQNEYIAMPLLAYINSAKMIDKLPLSAIEFEDDIGFGKKSKMIEYMRQELENKNQKSLDGLINNLGIQDFSIKSSSLKYNVVDLSNKNKLTRLIYYVMFDRKTLKRRIGEVTYKFRKRDKEAKEE